MSHSQRSHSVRSWVLPLLAVVLLLGSLQVEAELCSLDNVPAATLLLPYFEVDLSAAQGEGVNTLFTIHNAFPTPTLTHVSLWTDWSQPVLNFDVFLTGYDAQTIDLYDVLANGNIPLTADAQSDPGDLISPHGGISAWDGSFPQTDAAGSVDCANVFPFLTNPVLAGALLAEAQAKFTGAPIEGACFGSDQGDSRARGYITIDNVDSCSLLFPSDLEYFTDGVNRGVASFQNQLWGDWYVFDPNNSLTLSASPLVHIEAKEDLGFFGDTNYTFYGRYTTPNLTIDVREPLANAWGFRYQTSEPSWVTDLVVWRDSTVFDHDPAGYDCSGSRNGPEWKPLWQGSVQCFNQAEEVVELCSKGSCFPLESQRMQFDTGELSVPYDTGWCRVEFGFPDGVFVNFDYDPPGDVMQGWVGATDRSPGIVTSGLTAIDLGHACNIPPSP